MRSVSQTERPVSRRRFAASRLLWTTSLMGSLFAGANPVLAQSLPGAGDVVGTPSISGLAGDAAPDFHFSGTADSVDLNAKATVIEWKSFNVPDGTTFDFNTARTDKIAVLNRVVGDAGVIPISTIKGSISTFDLTNNAINNVAVFLVNPSGVTFSENGAFSGGSLVLSTLNIADSDFLDVDPFYSFTGSSDGVIDLSGAGVITTTDGLFAALGENLAIDKTITATGGDVVLVAATDVKLTIQSGSPLAIEVKAGTPLGTASVGADGKLTGKSVVFAGASTAMANLLAVESGAELVATDTNGRVIIAAGAGSDVSYQGGGSDQAYVLFNASVAAGENSATFSGAVKNAGATSPQFVAATSGNFTADSDIETTGDVSITAVKAATVAANVTAGGNYSVTGAAVTLGNATTSATQAAKGSVAITSKSGDVTGVAPGAGVLTLKSDSDISGAEGLSVSATGGAIDLGTKSLLVGADTGLVRANVTLDAGGNGVTVGQIYANTLFAPTTGDFTAGSASTDIIDTLTGLVINTDGAISIQSATVGAGQNIIIGSSGAGKNVSVGGDLVNGQVVAVTAGTTAAGGIATVAGNVAAGNSFAVTGKSVVLGNGGTVSQTAVDGLAINAGSGGVSASGTLSLQSDSDGSAAPGSFVDRLQIDSDGAVNLGIAGRLIGGKTPAALTDERQARVIINTSSGGVTTGKIDAYAYNLASSGDVVAGGDIATIDSVILSTAGAVSVQGVNASAGNVELRSTGTGNNVLATGRVAASGSVTIAAGSIATGGTADLRGQVAAGSSIAITGKTALLGDGMLPDTHSAGTSYAVMAGSGGAIIAPSWSLSAPTGPVTFTGAVSGDNNFSITTAGAISVENVAMTGANHTITLTSTGSTISSGALSAPSLVSVDANDSATVSGNVSASAGNIVIRGKSVVLGNTSTSTSLLASGGIFVTSSAGGVTGLSPVSGNLVLISDTDTSGAESLNISATGGAIDLGDRPGALKSVLIGGSVAGGRANVLVDAGGSSVIVGDIYAKQFVGPSSGDFSAGSGTGGTIDTLTDLVIVTDGSVNINNAKVASGNIILRSTGVAKDVTVNGSLSGGQIVAVLAGTTSTGGTATVNGAVAAGASYAVTGKSVVLGNGALTLQSAATNIAINAGTGGVTGNGALTLQSSTGNTGDPDQLEINSGGSVAMAQTSLLGGTAREADVYVTSTTGSIGLKNIAGRAVSLSGPLDDVTVSGLVDAQQSLSIVTAGSITLGEVTLTDTDADIYLESTGAGEAVSVTTGLTAGRNIAASGETVSVKKATATAGALSLTANGNSLTLGTGNSSAGTIVSLVKTGGTGDLRVSGDLTAEQGITANSSTDMLIGDLVTLTSNNGDINLTATDSIFGLSGPEAIPGAGDAVRIASLSTVGDASIVAAAGDVRADSISSSAGNVSLDVGGSLTGRATSDVANGVSGGTLLANGAGRSIGVNAGNIARFNRVQANANVTVSGAGIAIGTASGGSLSLNAGSLGLYLDSANSGSTASLTSTGTAQQATDISTTNPDNRINTGFGRTGISANQSVGIGTGLLRQLDGVSATNGNISIVGAAITANNVMAPLGSLLLTANNGGLYLGNATTRGGTVARAGTTAIFAKNGAGPDGDEIRFDGAVISGGNVTVTSATDVRLTAITSTTGNIGVTASGGDVSGFLQGAAGDGRLLDTYARGDLTASAVDATITVSASGSSGFIQLGSVTAGLAGSTNTGPDQISITGNALDIVSATSRNGSINLAALSGALKLDSGIAATSLSLTSSGKGIFGSLSAAEDLGIRAGDTVTATSTAAGDDIVIVAGGASSAISNIGSASTSAAGVGVDTRHIDFGGPTLGIVAGEDAQLGRKNITVDAASSLTAGVFGTAGLTDSIALRTSGALTVASATAVEDFGARSINDATIAFARAGDDITVTSSAGNVTLTDAATSGAGADDRQTDLSGAGIILAGGETLNRSNILADAFGNLTLGTVRANATLASRAGGTITGTTLTAGEDIALRGVQAVSVTSGTAMDDVELSSTAGAVTLNGGAAGGGTLDDRTADFSGTAITLSLPEDHPGGSAFVDAFTNATVGTTSVSATKSIAIRAKTGLIDSTALNAGEDIATTSAGTTHLGTATAGDDIIVLSGGTATLDTLTTNNGGLGNSEIVFGSPRITFASDTPGFGDIIVDTGGSATLGTLTAFSTIAVRAVSDIGAASLTAGEDIATSSGGATSINFALAGDDIDLTAGGNITLNNGETTGLGLDNVRVDFSGANIGFSSETLGRSNIAVKSGGAVDIGSVKAKARDSLAVQASGGITGGTLSAREDIATSSGAATTIASAMAGDDIDMTAGSDATLTVGMALGTGADDRRVAFSGAAITFGGETLGRSDIAVKTGGDATLGTVNAAASIGVLANGVSSIITGASLTAGEDIATRSSGSTALTFAQAGDDIDTTSGVLTALAGNATLTMGTTTGAGADDRKVDFTLSQIDFAAEDLAKSNIIVDAGGDATLGTTNSSATTAVRATGASAGSTGLITGASVTAGEDVSTNSLGATTLTFATAGDDIDMTAGGNATLTTGTTNAALGSDTRRVNFGNAARIALTNGDTLARSNVAVATSANADLGTVTAVDSIGVRANGLITAASLTAGEDIATKSGLGTVLTFAKAGDDIDVTAGGDTTLTAGETTGLGSDTRRVDFGGAQIGFGAETLARSNVAVATVGNVTLGTVKSAASIGVVATGSITATKLTALEDVATNSGTTTLLTEANAGDDIDITAGTDATLTKGDTTGLGADDRRVAFAGGIVSFGGETLGRSNVAVKTGGNADLGTITAIGSIGVLANGATSTIMGASLTAGEDIATRSSGATTLTFAQAGDDIDVTSGVLASIAGNATLTTGTSTGAGADDRKVDFTQPQIGFAAEDLAKSNIIVDAGGDATLGTTNSNAMTAVRAKGLSAGSTGAIAGTNLTAGEDIATNSLGATTLTTATAGDDIDMTAGGNATLTTGTTSAAVGTDTRRADFSNATRISVSGAETLGRSNVAVKTGGNADLGTVTAINSIGVLANGVTSTVTGASLTAGEDIATRASGTTALTFAQAGDDIDMTSGVLASIAGNATLTTGTSTGAGADDRKVDFTQPQIGFAAEDLLTSNIVVDAGGDATLGTTNSKAMTAIRAKGLSAGSTGAISGADLTAGDDIATKSLGNTTITLAAAGDDIDITAGGVAKLITGSTSARPGSDTRRVDFGNAARIALGGAETLGRSNVAVLAGSDADLGTVTAVDSIAARAGGGILGASLTAGEDIATNSGLGTTLTFAKAGDDIDVTAGGDAAIVTGQTTGLGSDTRRVDFAGAQIGFGGETLGRSNVVVKTGGNADLTTITTINSIGVLANGTTSTITGTSLTAGEDIATRSSGATTLILALAGDDIDTTSGVLASLVGNAALTTGTTTGAGADDRKVDFAGTQIGFAAEDLAKSNIVVDAGGDATLGTTSSKATTAVRAKGLSTGSTGLITGGSLTAGEDIATSSFGTTTLTTATAGDDIDMTAGGNATLTTGITSAAAGSDTRRADFSNAARISVSGTETLGRSNVAVKTARNADLGAVTAADTIAVDAGGSILGASLTAGEDIVTKSGTATTLTFAKAGDDIITLAATDATLTDAMTTGLGSDSRTVVFGSAIGFGTTANPTRSNIIVDAGANATLGSAIANATLAVRAGTGSINGTTLSAGEDIALKAGADALIGSATARDDLTITAGNNVSLTDGKAMGGGSDSRSVSFGTPISVDAAEPVTLARGNAVIDAGGSAKIDSLTAAASLTVRAGIDIASSVLLSAGEDLGLSSGGKADILVASAGDDAIVKTGTTATIGTITSTGAGADDRQLVFGGSAITIVNGEAAPAFTASNIDIGAQSALVTTASASRDLTIRASTGQLSLVDGMAGRLATLDKKGSDGDLAVTGNLNAGSDITIGSTTDVRLANDKAIKSTGGSIGVTATRSVFAVAGQSAAPTPPQIGSLVTSGNLALTGAGDVRANTLQSTGGDVTVDIGGALTGTKTGAPLATVTGGKLSAVAAGQSVTVTAGNASGNVAYLRDIEAGKDVTVSANGIAINTLTVGKAGPGVLTLTAGSGGVNLGTTMVTGAAAINIGGVAAALPDPLYSTMAKLDAAYGEADVMAGGKIAVNALTGLAQLDEAVAGTSVALDGKALTARIATATNGPLTMHASTGGLYLGTGISGSTATLTKDAGAVGNAGDELRVITSLASVGKSTLTSSTSARLGSVAASAGAVEVTATTGAVTGIALGTPAGIVDPAFGRANLAAAGAGSNIKVTAATLAQLGTATAANDETVAAQQIDITNATATAGLLDLKATTGELYLDKGVAGTTATLAKTGAAGELRVTTSLTAGGAATIGSTTNARLGAVTSTGGDLAVTSTLATTGIAGASTGTSDTSFGRANLSAAAATKSVTVTSGALAQLGTVVAGKDVTVTAGNLTTNGAIDVTRATATTGALNLTARAVAPVADAINDGDVILGTGISGGAALLTNKAAVNPGTVGNVRVTTSLSAGISVDIVSNGEATGGLVEAKGGNTTITAAPLAQFDTVNATGNVATGATSILFGSSTAGGALALTASGGQLTLGTGTAGTTATLAKTGATGDLQVTTSLKAGGLTKITSTTNAGLGAVESTGGNIEVTSERIALNGAVKTTGAAASVTLTNLSTVANATAIGATGTEATDFLLTDAEMDRISTANLTIESGTQNVNIGTLSLNGATGSGTLRLLSNGASNVSLGGIISQEAATARKFQIGGTAAATPSLVSTELASTIIATTQATGGGRIVLPSADIDLRAGRIIFGLASLISDTRTLTPDAVAVNFVSRPNSTLYNSIGGFDQNTGTTIIGANSLTLRYTGFSLIQNTAPAGLNGGVVLGDNSGVVGSTPRLILFSTAETPVNSIGLFGTINGIQGNATALLPNAVLNIREGDTGAFRISRSSSRLNGCAIGAPEQGCLTTQSPPPILRLFDERQALVFRTADDAVLPFDPLVGTNNESLFIDFGGVSLPYDDSECPSGAAATTACPQPGDKK